MISGVRSGKLDRRTIIKAAAAAGVAQLAAPFVTTARAADEVKFGLDNPLTGTYAALGKNELIGASLAIDQINAKGGILGRRLELLVEDSTSGDTGTAVQKARKLIERDKVDFLLGNINSALASAIGQASNVQEGHVPHRARRPHRPGHRHRLPLERLPRLQHDAHGNQCGLQAADQQIRQEMVLHHARLRLRPYACRQGFEASLKQLGGTEVGADSDAARHHRLLVLPDQGAVGEPGRRSSSCSPATTWSTALKQAVQFGLDKKFHIAGAQQELEVLEGLPPEARIGTWVFEWYWKQPDVPHVEEFVADIRKGSGGQVPTARTWFGYAAIWTCALAAEQGESRSRRSRWPRRCRASNCRRKSR